jgi:hypothetical protein
MELIYLFSIWIFIWWVFYKLRMITYSPIFALWVAAWFNVAIISGMILNQNDPFFIMYFTTVSLKMMKLVPLATLNESITQQSIHAFVVLFSIYLIFSYATGMTIGSLLENYTNAIFAPEKTVVGQQYEVFKNIYPLYEPCSRARTV